VAATTSLERRHASLIQDQGGNDVVAYIADLRGPCIAEMLPYESGRISLQQSSVKPAPLIVNADNAKQSFEGLSP
jgi:hypothetical protein